jgi:PAS domain S-box-containing protein
MNDKAPFDSRIVESNKADGAASAVSSRKRILELPDRSAQSSSSQKGGASLAALRLSEIRYRRLFEAARDGVLLVDPATAKIVDANPFMVELLGYTHDEFVGKELWEIGLLKDEKVSREMFGELREKHYIRYEDLPLKSTNGRVSEVEVVANLYQEDEQDIIQCNIRDTTERKRVERALLAANYQISRHAAELD